MENKETDTKKINFTFRLMASYSILLLIILFMGIYLYSISVDNIQSGIREQNQTILRNSIEQLDTDFTSMSVLVRQMANHSELVRLSNMNANDNGDFYLLASQVKKDLSMFLPSHMLLPIDSYFIWLQSSNYLLSFDHFEDMEDYYSRKRLLDADMYPAWKAMLSDSENHYQMIPVSPYSNSYTSAADNYFYIMSLEDFSFKQIPASICFELNTESLQQIFSELNLYENGYICVTNSEGKPIFTMGQETKKTKAEQAALLSGLTYDANGFSTYSTDHRTMMVTSCTSNYNKWNYYLVQPANSTFYSLGSYRSVFILCVSGALIFGFLLILLLSRKNSRPLEDMSGLLTESRLQQQELLELAKQQEPLLRTSYVRQIMKGTIASPEELEYVKDYLSLNDDSNLKYLVLYCNVYLNKYEVSTGVSAIVGIAPNDYDTIIKDALVQFFGKPLYLFSPQERTYAILLSSKKDASDESVYDYITAAFTGLHNYLMENHSIWIFGGLGNRNGLLAFTWKSFQQARETSQYTTNEHFFCCYDQLNRDSLNYYYPAELSKQLTGFVEAGNQQQIAEIFKLIKKENLIKRSLPFNQINWLLSDIRNTLLKIRFSIPNTEAAADSLKAIDVHFEEAPSMKLYEDLTMELCGLMGRDTSENQLISNIKNYIAHNYTDPALCLSKISDEFSISESYFSFLFKKTSGENFSVYLEQLRMEQAIHLIKETNTKISELYLKLGYNNPNSFRRAFKKVYGVSPNSIRESDQTPSCLIVPDKSMEDPE